MSRKKSKIIARQTTGLHAIYQVSIKVICKDLYAIYSNYGEMVPDISHLKLIDIGEYNPYQETHKDGSKNPSIGLLDSEHMMIAMMAIKMKPFRIEEIAMPSAPVRDKNDMVIEYLVSFSVENIQIYADLQAEMLSRIEAELGTKIASRETVGNAMCSLGEFASLTFRFRFADYTSIFTSPAPIFPSGSSAIAHYGANSYKFTVTSEIEYPTLGYIEFRILSMLERMRAGISFNSAKANERIEKVRSTWEKIKEISERIEDLGFSKDDEKSNRDKNANGSIDHKGNPSKKDRDTKIFSLSHGDNDETEEMVKECLKVMIKNATESTIYWYTNPLENVIIDTSRSDIIETELDKAANLIDGYQKIATRVSESASVITRYLSILILSDIATVIEQMSTERALNAVLTFYETTIVDLLYLTLDLMEALCVGMIVFAPPVGVAMTLTLGASIELMKAVAPHEKVRQNILEESLRFTVPIERLAALNEQRLHEHTTGYYLPALRRLLSIFYRFEEDKKLSDLMLILCGNREKFGAPILAFSGGCGGQMWPRKFIWGPGQDGGHTEIDLRSNYYLIK